MTAGGDHGGDDPHAAYLDACTAEGRERLLAIRAEWEARIPGTTRCIAYRMPALAAPRAE